MTHETATPGQEFGYSHHGYGRHFGGRGDFFHWAKTPEINPPKVLAVVAGFLVFPPLGLGLLGYFWWNSRRQSWGGPAYAGTGRCGRGMRRSGNSAFDEQDRKSTRLNSSHGGISRMPSSA